MDVQEFKHKLGRYYGTKWRISLIKTFNVIGTS